MSKNRDGTDGLTLLKKSETNCPTGPDEAVLETFANRYSMRDYQITFECPEFTTLCPITDQPDFGHIKIQYIPDKQCIESKSLKLYLFSYRNYNTFHEDSVNRILDDIIENVAPREAVVEGVFRPRGGISITVTASHIKAEE